MNPIPKHIAIIMDGNGRWAKNHGLPRIEGHRQGVNSVEEIVEECLDLGIMHLTLYAFSDENWRRPEVEVEALMHLLASFVQSKCSKMLKNGIRFRTIGDLSKLPEEVRKEVDNVKNKTASCSKMDLILALSYGARSEITRAVNKILSTQKSKVTPGDITANLDTFEIPDPDLLIRTSGERRLSNFLLWQLAYAELYFTDILWPDFSREELLKAVKDYQIRERRFGQVEEV